MRKTLTALAASTLVAIVAPAVADGSRSPAGRPVAGAIVSAPMVGVIARPNYPGAVVYEYAQPGPVYYDFYAPQARYLVPPLTDPCEAWQADYRVRLRVC